MKATIRFNLNLEVLIETKKGIDETSVLELELNSNNLGDCLSDVLRHMNTRSLLNEKINSDYKAIITSVTNKERKIVI